MRKKLRPYIEFNDEPHLIAPMEDYDLWMAFF
jgi:hypothetical protein